MLLKIIDSSIFQFFSSFYINSTIISLLFFLIIYLCVSKTNDDFNIHLIVLFVVPIVNTIILIGIVYLLFRELWRDYKNNSL